MRLRIGTSTEPDVGAALAAASRAALARSAAPAFALVLSTFDYPAEEVALAAERELGSIPWAGVVTPAILTDGKVMPRGVAVGVLDCERLRARVGAPESPIADAREAGRAAARDALAGMPLPPADRSRAMLLFASTQHHDAAEVVHGALSVAGAGIAWCGGGTGALDAGTSGAQFAKGQAFRERVAAVTLDCHARVGVGIKHGWQPTGPPAMVTRAKSTLVEQLEHRPAFDIYRAAAAEVGQHLEPDDFVRFAMSHPLGIPQADGEYLVRDPLALEEAGALRFLAGVPDGAIVRVMEGTPAMLVEAARAAATMARKDVAAPIGGALVFDCISRYLMLGDSLQDELSACHAALGDDVPVLGCLTFGEVGAFGSRLPQFHNKTMVVLALPA
jgi:hypothetical protein